MKLLYSLILLTASLRAQTASLGPHLTPDAPVLTTVQTQMAAQHWTAIRLFPTQSFPLLLAGKPIGTLISGDARPSGQADKCFITLVEPTHPLTVHTTVDEIQYVKGIPACQTVRALGLLRSPDPAFLRIGILYTISQHIQGNNHGVLDATDVFVLSLNLKTLALTIDQAATDKAAAKSPENLPALAAALEP